MSAEPKRAENKKSSTPTSLNRRARFDYFIEETLEVGIALKGSEVKSIRAGKVSLAESHARVIRGELFIYGMNVAPYERANSFAPELDPIRARKALAHRRQINKLDIALTRKGYTLVPLKLYFLKGRVKILLGLGKGKRMVDKRETIKRREFERASRRGQEE